MKQYTLTLVVPVYNEARRIKPFLKALLSLRLPSTILLNEVRFINDGSTDNTKKLLEMWKPVLAKKIGCTVKILSYEFNRGRGCPRKGLTRICTDYAVYADGDLDIPLSNVESLGQPFSDGVDIVLGSKKMPGSVCTQKRRIDRVLLGYGHSLMAGIILGRFLWDYQGGFKAFSRKCLERVLPHMTIDRWGFDMEIVMAGFAQGFLVREIPLVWGALTCETTVRPVADSLRAIHDMLAIRKNVSQFHIKPMFSKITS